MNQFTGPNFDGTPINQLINTHVKQPANDIMNLVQNINNHLNTSHNNEVPANYMNNQNYNHNYNQNYNQNANYNNINDNNDNDDMSNDLEENTETSTDVKEKIKKMLKKKKKNKRNKKKIESYTDDNSSFEYFKYLNKDTKELLMLTLLYCILSLGIVKKMVGNYISYINPDNTGKYSFISIILYGFLLATLFIISKKMLIN